MDQPGGATQFLRISDALEISFHRAARVPDHEDPSKQTVATSVDHSAPCTLTPSPEDGSENTYLIALDCPPGGALQSTWPGEYTCVLSGRKAEISDA